VCIAQCTNATIPAGWCQSAESSARLQRQGTLPSSRVTKSQRQHASRLLMCAFADKNVAFNFATSSFFQDYVAYISQDMFSAPSRWDLVRSLEELCDVITTKVGRLLRESCFISICADAWTSAGCHVRAITAGNPGLTIYMNSYENLGTHNAVSGAEAVAACILTSILQAYASSPAFV
jgi:hypothetical protein